MRWHTGRCRFGWQTIAVVRPVERHLHGAIPRAKLAIPVAVAEALTGDTVGGHMLWAWNEANGITTHNPPGGCRRGPRMACSWSPSGRRKMDRHRREFGQVQPRYPIGRYGQRPRHAPVAADQPGDSVGGGRRLHTPSRGGVVDHPPGIPHRRSSRRGRSSLCNAPAGEADTEVDRVTDVDARHRCVPVDRISGSPGSLGPGRPRQPQRHALGRVLDKIRFCDGSPRSLGTTLGSCVRGRRDTVSGVATRAQFRTARTGSRVALQDP